MITIDCQLGSPEWLTARLGLPTASQFGRIVTPKTLKPSASAIGYRHELCAEWLIGEPIDPVANDWMDRGTELEPQAVKYYEAQRDIDTIEVGLCLTDDRTAGCSPDRLIGDDGGLEIKCPSAKVHVGYLMTGVDRDHMAQVQGCLWVTGRRWWDVMSFNPAMPPSIVRVERDPKYMDALDGAMAAFVEKLAEMRDKLTAMGCTPKPPKKERAVTRRKIDRPPINAESVPEMVGASGSDRYEALVDYVAARNDIEMDDAAVLVAEWMKGTDRLVVDFVDDFVWQRVRQIATAREWQAVTA